MPIHRLQLPINCHEQSPNPALVSSNALGHVESTLSLGPCRTTQFALLGLGPCRRSHSRRNHTQPFSQASRRHPALHLRRDGCPHASWVRCRGDSDFSRDLMRPFAAAGSTSKKGQTSWRCLVFCQFGLIHCSRRVPVGKHTTHTTPVATHFPPHYTCFEACLLLLALSRRGSTGLSHCV